MTVFLLFILVGSHGFCIMSTHQLFYGAGLAALFSVSAHYLWTGGAFLYALYQANVAAKPQDLLLSHTCRNATLVMQIKEVQQRCHQVLPRLQMGPLVYTLLQAWEHLRRLLPSENPEGLALLLVLALAVVVLVSTLSESRRRIFQKYRLPYVI